MKPLVKDWYLIVLYFLFVSVLFFGGNAYSLQQRTNDTVEGTEIITFWVNTTGAWQAITLPSTIEDIRHVSIQVHDGSQTEYTHIDNVVEFQVSGVSGGTGWSYSTGITFGIGKERNEIICYVKAAAGQKIAVICLR